MPIFSFDEISAQKPFQGVSVKLAIGKASGSGAITVGQATLEAGARLPLHIHKIEEAIIVLEGKGSVGLGGEKHPLKENCAILVPAGIKHEFHNDGDVPLKLLFMYPAVEPERILV